RPVDGGGCSARGAAALSTWVRRERWPFEAHSVRWGVQWIRFAERSHCTRPNPGFWAEKRGAGVESAQERSHCDPDWPDVMYQSPINTPRAAGVVRVVPQPISHPRDAFFRRIERVHPMQ